MKRWKRIVVSFVALGLVGTTATSVMTPRVTAASTVFEPKTKSTAALLVDLNSGRILGDKNGSQRLPLGSVSKLVVAYFIEEAVKQGKLSWDQKIKIKPKFAEYSHDMSVATVPLRTDGVYTLKDIMNAALIPSSNSASLILADLIAGNQKKFNEMADAKLASWGIPDAKWSSASGLPVGALGPFKTNDYDEDDMNRLSAREAAIIAGRLLTDYPHVLTFNSKVSAQFPDGKGGYLTIDNTNELLKDSDYKVEGMKTGTILEYGKNLVAKTYIHGVPVLSVILNAMPAESETEVFVSSKKMWNQASDALVAHTLPKGTDVGSVKANNAKSGTVEGMLAENQRILLGRHEAVPTFDNFKLDVEAPYKANQEIGTSKWHFGADAESYLPDAGTVRVMTKDSVEEANWFVRMWRSIFN